MKRIRMKQKSKEICDEAKTFQLLKSSGFFTIKGKKSIGDLIRSKEWSAVRNWLFGNKIDKRMSILEEKTMIGTSCLHILCSLHPPLVLVTKTVEICPELVLLKDNLGRLPLHIAAGWGASPQVISFLLAFYIDGASTQDINGKTPLIWAFENMKNPRINNGLKEVILADTGGPFGELSLGPIDIVVQYLTDAASESVILKDKSGNTALDYAIENECNAESLNLLQLAVAKENRIQMEINSTRFLKRYSSGQRFDAYNRKCKFHPLFDDRIKLKKESKFHIISEYEKNNKKEKKKTITQEQFSAHVMEILGVSNNQVNIDDVTLDTLRERYPDCFKAAQYGFKASKHYKPQCIPLIVEVEHGNRDDCSETS